MDVTPHSSIFHTRVMTHCRVMTLGNQRDPAALLRRAADLGYEIKHQVVPPSDQNESGFQAIPYWNNSFLVQAEGMVCQPGSAYLISSRDCPIVVIENCLNRRVVFCHAGRPALTPPCANGCGANVVSAALQAIAPRGTSARGVHAYITAGISGHNFPHDHSDQSWQLVQPFLESYGSYVFADRQRGALSLESVIRASLTRRDVPDNHIYHDGVCTYDNPGLASYRRQKEDGGPVRLNYVLILTNKEERPGE